MHHELLILILICFVTYRIFLLLIKSNINVDSRMSLALSDCPHLSVKGQLTSRNVVVSSILADVRRQPLSRERFHEPRRRTARKFSILHLSVERQLTSRNASVSSMLTDVRRRTFISSTISRERLHEPQTSTPRSLVLKFTPSSDGVRMPGPAVYDSSLPTKF